MAAETYEILGKTNVKNVYSIASNRETTNRYIVIFMIGYALLQDILITTPPFLMELNWLLQLCKFRTTYKAVPVQ